MDITYPRVPGVLTETGERKRRETRAAAKRRRREDKAQGENVRRNPKYSRRFTSKSSTAVTITLL